MTDDKPKDHYKLPAEMENAIELFTAMYMRFKELEKKDPGDWMERFAYFLAGMGVLGWMIQTVQWLMFLSGGP